LRDWAVFSYMGRIPKEFLFGVLNYILFFLSVCLFKLCTLRQDALICFLQPGWCQRLFDAP
jgi:hypothetical protein